MTGEEEEGEEVGKDEEGERRSKRGNTGQIFRGEDEMICQE